MLTLFNISIDGEVYSIQHYVIKFSVPCGRRFFSGYYISSTNTPIKLTATI